MQSNWTSPVALSSSDLSSLLMMSKTSGERIIPFLFAISLTNPDEVVLLMIASVKSRFSSGSWAAYWIAEDFPVREKSNTL